MGNVGNEHAGKQQVKRLRMTPLLRVAGDYVSREGKFYLGLRRHP
jgi:hypothetical protein